MTVQLTIIGLGQIGASVGMALAKHSDKITRFGHDREPNIARQAHARGAVDKIFFNLPASVENSRFILLALPFDQVHETLKVIAPDLREGTVVMDTSPLKSKVAAWAKECLPPNCYYVGLTPAINPLYLNEEKDGVEAAHADLFSEGLMGIAAPQGTAGEAVKLATDLATLLGAKPYFFDLTESDGMMSALHVLPQLSAAALMNMLKDRPGWIDARKIAGGVFAKATLPVVCGDEEAALVETALQDPEKIIPVLDELIASLEAIKANISAQERGKLAEWVQGSREGRAKWWHERLSGDWLAVDNKIVAVPKVGLGRRLFGDLGKLFKPPKPPGEEEKK